MKAFHHEASLLFRLVFARFPKHLHCRTQGASFKQKRRPEGYLKEERARGTVVDSHTFVVVI